MPPNYSPADEKAMLYVYSILGAIIAVSVYFCLRYNNQQTSKRLKAEGTSIYCRVDSAFKIDHGRGGVEHHLAITYDRFRQKNKVDLVVSDQEFSAYKVSDTVILRKLPHNNASSYMKIIGSKSNGAELFVKY
ncbi:hypothetical protein [Mucilaginibacter glaciei]|uniref:Uncharacterized protein n=1 Tax=Mucilaginibacter glaciei TaxID=2772109 RepID=A0A926NMU0_9SPHI|nr:hypothetical protein [Mucilaginibacter glaciei]MBD1391787.1 hypothetical protein [Mucilaginibacter glaciei]